MHINTQQEIQIPHLINLMNFDEFESSFSLLDVDLILARFTSLGICMCILAYVL